MRGRYLDLIWRDVKAFGFHVETGLLAILILDAHCPEWDSTELVEFKVLYIAALRIAMKFNEVNQPSILMMLWKGVSSIDVNSTEADMLQGMDYRVRRDTVATFLGNDTDRLADAIRLATYDAELMKQGPEAVAATILLNET